MNVSTDVKESNGWCRRQSWYFNCSNRSLSARRQNVRGHDGGSFNPGRCSRADRQPVREPDSRRRFRDHVVFDLEVLLQDVQDALRRVVLDLEQRHGPVPHVPEAQIDRLEQVVRIALLHDDVRVANDAEQMRA